MAGKYFSRILAGFNRHSLGLGVTMTIGYGVLFYSFAILAPAIMAEFGWTRTFVFGAFSAALLSGAFLAPLAGRLLDRYGGRQVLSGGTILASLALVLLAQTGSPAQFIAGLVAVEAASAFVLYEAGFAMLTQIHGRAARAPISAVTLIAGFSSTLFWPLCSFLLAHYTWREVYFWLAAINFFVAMPIHLSLPRARHLRESAAAVHQAPHGGVADGRSRTRAVLTMGICFAANGFAIAAVQTHFPRLFVEAGYSVAAAAAFGALIGPFQVGARVFDILFGQSRHPVLVGTIANSALTLGIACLLFLSWGWGAAIAFALLFGIGQGLANIIRGAIPLALFGPSGYGRLTGNLAVARVAMTAAAPVTIAWISDASGNNAAIGAIVIAAAISLLALLPLVAFARER